MARVKATHLPAIVRARIFIDQTNKVAVQPYFAFKRSYFVL